MIKIIDWKYCINDKGEVFTTLLDLRMKPRMIGNYMVVNLHRTQRGVSSLMLEAFVGAQPDGHLPKCKNGNTQDMNIDNWSWEPTKDHLKKTRAKERASRNKNFDRKEEVRIRREKKMVSPEFLAKQAEKEDARIRAMDLPKSDFWDVNDAQRDHFSTFFGLVRPKAEVKGRVCMKCRVKFSHASYRRCTDCRIKTVGALASL